MCKVLLKKNEAIKQLGLSSHSFDKCVKEGKLTCIQKDDINYYSKEEIDFFKNSDYYKQLLVGSVDNRNTLNDLTGKEWIAETKSYFYQKGLGADSDDAKIEKQHPAPFSFQDIEKLLLFFTKKNMTVLDPFGGVGSTAKACELTKRRCISIELSEKYHNLSIQRLEKEVGEGCSNNHQFILGDTLEVLPTIDSDSIDMVVTSPPYWNILHKQDQKVKKNRVSNNLDTQYSDNDKDLGNINKYETFLNTLVNRVFLQCARCLKSNKYLLIIVSDFRDKSKFYSFHSDLIYNLNDHEIPDGGKLMLAGTKILIQNHKSLHPYGYPFSYVENIHHQYVLIFRKKRC